MASTTAAAVAVPPVAVAVPSVAVTPPPTGAVAAPAPAPAPAAMAAPAIVAAPASAPTPPTSFIPTAYAQNRDYITEKPTNVKARAGPTPRKQRIMKIMAWTALGSVVIFGAIFAGLFAASFAGYCSGSPYRDYAKERYCNGLSISAGIFFFILIFSLVFAIIVAILRCTPWYRGRRVAAVAVAQPAAVDVEAHRAVVTAA